MPRRLRCAVGGEVYHVLNRAAARFQMFRHEKDYLAMEQVLLEALQRIPMRVLCYCLMPNHWHMVVWPNEDGQLSRFMNWLTLTHAQRWRHAHATVGYGSLYQGRFKCFPIQRDEHLIAVCRYVERNPLRANLVTQAEHWRWCSLWQRLNPTQPVASLLCSRWPVDRQDDWPQWLNTPQTDAEIESIRLSVKRGRPYGGDAWMKRTAIAQQLLSSLRDIGRPKRTPQPTGTH